MNLNAPLGRGLWQESWCRCLLPGVGALGFLGCSSVTGGGAEPETSPVSSKSVALAEPEKPPAERSRGGELEAKFELVLASDVEWTHLNPARGDKAPSAATLWGDRKGKKATGFLLKPSDGFSSPPHIHNVSYRGVVIRGLLHNDDPNAETTWMPTGSFWTQPQGQLHITSAKGADVLAYIEIEKGPYLVRPSEEAFDSGERAINVDSSNLVWLGGGDLTWVGVGSEANPHQEPKVAFLWGGAERDRLRGDLVRLPAGFHGELRSEGADFRSVVIQGEPALQQGASGTKSRLHTGSYFRAHGRWTLGISSRADAATLLYVRTDGPYEIHSD